MNPTSLCVRCGRAPDEIPEYREAAAFEEMSPAAYARSDGTYNPENGHFYCDKCYIEAGLPLGVAP